MVVARVRNCLVFEGFVGPYLKAGEDSVAIPDPLIVFRSASHPPALACVVVCVVLLHIIA